MTTPSEPTTTPGWAAPTPPGAGSDGARPAGPPSGAPAGPADGAHPTGPPPTQPTATQPGATTPQPGVGPVPPSGWGPGYTAGPAGGYGPGYGRPPAPQAPLTPPGGGYGSGPGAPPRPLGFAPPAPRPGIVPLRPLGLGEILDGAFRAIRHNPRVMFGLSAIVVAVTVAIQAVLQWYVGGLLAGQLGGVADTLDPTGELAIAEMLAPNLALLLTTPLLSIATTVLTGLLIVSVSRSVIGRTISVGEVWSQAWRRVLVLLGFSLAVTLLILLVWGAWIGALALLGTAEQWGAVVVLGLLGGLALLAGPVWFGIRILLVPATLVLEGTDVRTAVRRGWGLTRGSFWRLLGIYLLTSIMVAFVAGLIAAPAGMISALLLGDPLLTSFGGIALSSLANVVAYTLTTSFMAAVLALLYVDVRMRREGLDVELARAAAETA